MRGLCFSVSAEAKTYTYVFNIGTGDVSIIDTEAQEVIVTVDVGQTNCANFLHWTAPLLVVDI
ncbi:MAG: hypothetical protein V3T19_05820, partial [Acidiferrobacterales bacterium]